MPWQEWALLVGTLVTVADFVFIVGIFIDDHAVRKMSQESLQISRESLAAQKEYLSFRRRWYEQRQKKQVIPSTDSASVKAEEAQLKNGPNT